MHEFMKTIISAIKSWVSDEIKDASRVSVADWNQNDANADNYVKNRPFYECNEIIHKLDPKFLPDDIGKQSDWNQNDITSNDHILNRTHFDSRGSVVCGPIEIEASYMQINLSDLDKLTSGMEYTVDWNGTQYICIAQQCDDGVCIGNRSRVYNGDNDYNTEEPFYIEWKNDGWHKLFVEDYGNYSLKITEGCIKKIDKKYLPNDVISGRAHVLHDRINGFDYVVQMQNGNLVSFVKCDRIEIEQMPNKTQYMLGDKFDPTGMVVVKVAQDGKRETIDNYKCTQYVTTYLNPIKIEYNEGDTYSCNVEVVVSPFDPNVALIDFDYYYMEAMSTYQLNSWKETLDGQPSTTLIVPDNKFVQL